MMLKKEPEACYYGKTILEKEVKFRRNDIISQKLKS